MELGPLLFEPILKPRVWGGRRLELLGKRLPPEAAIGESWELADLPGEPGETVSIIRGGDLDGCPLREVMQRHGEQILGAARPAADDRFPLLIKYLDARENLSVQVHPSAAYARAHPEAHLKSEAWYVVQAEPGAKIYRGLRRGVDRATLAAHAAAGTVADDLLPVDVAPGDCHYLPSGTCHALGAGVLVAEVQTPSDTTFRVYDWGRAGRELHVEQALQCIDFSPAAPQPAPPPPIRRGPVSSQPLLSTEFFELERLDVAGRVDVPVVTNGLAEIWMVLEGAARIRSAGAAPVDVPLGTTVLLPATLSDARATLDGPARILRITLPSPLAEMIARR